MKTIMMNGKVKMKEICPNEKCTSCMACYSVCPVQAIHIGQDEKGFYRPIIDSQKCIGCRQCIHVCPAHGNLTKNIVGKAVAAYAVNKKLRKNSTSGGLFSVLATYVLRHEGIVFGAAYDEQLVVRHTYVEGESDLWKLRVSKYVQSDIGDSFKQARFFLEAGKLVFFTGTPCQINGLKNYLGKNYQNLLTADLICHGVPPAKLFAEYLDMLEKKHHAQIQTIRFRYKTDNFKQIGMACEHNMKIVFENGETYLRRDLEDPYLLSFFSNLCINEACYHCPFTTEERTGDITLGDFWGFHAPSLSWVDTGKGISLLLLNNEKGKRFFSQIKSSCRWCERPVAEAVKGNPHLREPIKKNVRYEEFWKDYREHGYQFVAGKYFSPIPPVNVNNTIVVKIKKQIPLHLKWLIKRFLSGKVD